MGAGAMGPKRKTSRSNTRSRRSANMKPPVIPLSTCEHCSQMKPPHIACPNCGYYKGRQAVQV